jgi:hypothetical protein
MCRATCELLLKRHYGYVDSDQDAKGKPKHGPRLSDLIKMAEKEYDWVGALDLASQADHANGVVHNYDRQQSSAEADEKAVVKYLTTIRTLIERVDA